MTEPIDHLTIEQRLSRLEANQQTILDNQDIHGAAIREIVDKLILMGLWIPGPVTKANDDEPDDRKIYIGFKQKDKARD